MNSHSRDWSPKKVESVVHFERVHAHRDSHQGSPKVAVVVLNWNNSSDTIECLESILKSSHDDIDVILVDNNSISSDYQDLRSWLASLTRLTYPVYLVRTVQNLGYAGGNNVGMSLALKLDSAYIFVLNNDTVVERNAISGLVELMQKNEGIGVVGPVVLRYDNPSTVWQSGSRISSVTARIRPLDGGLSVNDIKNPVEDIDYVAGCSMLLRSSIVREIGGFDETYFAYYEDADLCARIESIGHRIVASKTSRIWHKVGSSTHRMPGFQSRYLSRNRLLFVWKNWSFFGTLVFSFWSVFGSSLDMASAVVRTGGFHCSVEVMKGLVRGVTTIINESPEPRFESLTDS